LKAQKTKKRNSKGKNRGAKAKQCSKTESVWAIKTQSLIQKKMRGYRQLANNANKKNKTERKERKSNQNNEAN